MAEDPATNPEFEEPDQGGFKNVQNDEPPPARMNAPTPPKDEDVEASGPGKSLKKKTPKREKNARFQDVENTGKWGTLSKTEIVVAATVAAVIVIAAAVGLGIALSRDPGSSTVPAPASPTMPPTNILPPTQLQIVETALGMNEFTIGLLADLPSDASVYENLDSPVSTPEERAMNWLLFEDSRDLQGEVVLRWTMAALYYHWGGEFWNSSRLWLSDAHICEWEFVDCNQNRDLRELDFSENNLSGTIPSEVVLLGNLTSLWLRGNNIRGKIPGAALGSMPKLGILYFDNNQLSGTIPVELKNSGSLHTLYLQRNNLNGTFPVEFCSSVPGGLETYGIDCDEVECVTGCCDEYSCFDSLP